VGLVDSCEAFLDTVYCVSLTRKLLGRRHKRPKILKGGEKERLCPRYLICGRPGTKDIDVILLSSNHVGYIYIPFMKETDRYDADAFGLFYWTVSISELDIILKYSVSLTLSRLAGSSLELLWIVARAAQLSAFVCFRCQ